MGKLKAFITMSADGYVAGPDQSEENPLGIDGEELHNWLIPLKAFNEAHGREGGEVTASSPVVEAWFENVGAEIMGRNMFGGGPGPWGDDEWKGWWGDEPPYHNPVFVLTHHEREPLEMKGGTTFYFVTDGIESALGQAREAAGDRDINIAGGAQAIQQYLAAGLLDELEISISPLLLGGGERLFDNLGDATIGLEQVRAVEGVGVTHITYRVVKG
jgi:dihydrofolate reductase